MTGMIGLLNNRSIIKGFFFLRVLCSWADCISNTVHLPWSAESCSPHIHTPLEFLAWMQTWAGSLNDIRVGFFFVMEVTTEDWEGVDVSDFDGTSESGAMTCLISLGQHIVMNRLFVISNSKVPSKSEISTLVAIPGAPQRSYPDRSCWTWECYRSF